jgi:low temperature requirement protein LtrA
MYPPPGTVRAWEKPVLRDDGDHHRPVGWVELFFDLVFVVIVAVLAGNLESGDSLLDFVLQFMAVFWVWNAFTYYTERFESHGLENRLFTFIGIVAVAGLAVWGSDGLAENYLGFAISYLLARGLNIALWLRAAVHVPRFRRAALGFTGGFVISLPLLIVSFFVPHQVRLLLWGLAVLVEIAAPALTGRFQNGLPAVSRDKFPERFGLLTMIVLGETVAGIIRSVALVNSRHQLSGLTIAEAVLALVIGFGLWWVYFDFVARRPSRQGIRTILTWVYLHLAMLIGIVAVGAAISEALLQPAGPRAFMERDVESLLLVGVGYTLVVIALIELTLERAPDEPTQPVISPSLKVGAGVVVALVAVVPMPAVAAFAAVVVALAIQAAYGAVSYYRRRAGG